MLAAAKIAIARLPEGGSPKRAKKLVARLKKRRKKVPSLRVASHLVIASLRLAMGDLDGTRSELEIVLSTAHTHSELWHELEATEMLSRMLSVRDSKASAELEARAAALHEQLAAPAPLRPPEPAGPPVPTIVSTEVLDTRLDLVAEGIPSLVERYLGGSSLVVEAQPGLRITAAPELIELLLVNLALAASDAVQNHTEITLTVATAAKAQLPPGHRGRAEDWVRIRLQAPDASGAGAQGALAECSELCRKLGGFLEVTQGEDLDIAAWLELEHPHDTHGLIVVIVDSDQLQRTLIEGVLQLGWSAQALSVDQPIPDEAAAVLADASALASLPEAVPVIPVIPRARGQEKAHALPLPFLIRELQALLEPLQARRVTSAAGKPPG